MGNYRRSRYLDEIMEFVDTNLIKVLTGIRRCGKSVILKQVSEDLIASGKNPKNIILIDMESKANWNLNNADILYDHISKLKGKKKSRMYVLIDEIQNVDGWERCIRALMSDMDVDIYITGSNSKLLSGELATLIAGRYVEIRIHPFSYAEVSDVYPDANRKDLFKKYVRFGGMPLVVMDGYDESKSMSQLSAMYDSIVLKDISSRWNIRSINTLDDVLMYAVSEIGHPISSNNISGFLKNQKRSATADSILSYLSYAEMAFFLSKASRYDIRGKSLLKLDYKFYVEDLGFREAGGMDNEADIDQSLENIVFNELSSRGYEVHIGSIEGKEVDFVARKGGDTSYYQVCYLMSEKSTREREFRSLAEIDDNYPKYVLSMDEFDFSCDGIIHKNIVDWLLDK